MSFIHNRHGVGPKTCTPRTWLRLLPRWRSAAPRQCARPTTPILIRRTFEVTVDGRSTAHACSPSTRLILAGFEEWYHRAGNDCSYMVLTLIKRLSEFESVAGVRIGFYWER